MFYDKLEIRTSADILLAFDMAYKVNRFLHYMMQALIETSEDEYVIEGSSTDKAPVFFSNIEENRLHIDYNWCSQTIIDYMNKNYDLDEISQLKLNQIFTSMNDELDIMIRRLLFVELFGRKYGLMTSKQLDRLGRHAYAQNTLFSFSNRMYFLWPSITISTKRLQKFVIENALEYEEDKDMSTFKRLVYRPNDINWVTTSQKEIDEVLAIDCDIWLRSYMKPRQKKAA